MKFGCLSTTVYSLVAYKTLLNIIIMIKKQFYSLINKSINITVCVCVLRDFLVNLFSVITKTQELVAEFNASKFIFVSVELVEIRREIFN